MPRTPKNRALVIGISNYPTGITNLPAVSNDVREMAKVLGSKNGRFSSADIRILTNRQAKRREVLAELKWAFQASPGATIFAYLAGHGAVADGQYYFVPHDTKVENLASTAIPLETIKSLFDKTLSTQAFLWLDFCHSGGILTREGITMTKETKNSLVERTLKVVNGKGKVIIAACTEEQSAYENSSHGLFTSALLRGLRGEAKTNGEVTVSSLYDFIDRDINNAEQRPMLFGKMTGRIVLMHYDDATATPKQVKQKASSVSGIRKGKSINAGAVVKTSGKWTLLGDDLFFEAQKVSHNPDGTVIVEVQSSNSTIDAAIKSLSHPQSYRKNELNFAHHNDALKVQVRSVASESRGQGQLWIISLQPIEQQTYGRFDDFSFNDGTRTYSPDEIAELRARQILLDERIAHRGTGVSSMFSLRGLYHQDIICPIREVYKAHSRKKLVWPKLARLKAITVLKETQTVENILELSIQPRQNHEAQIVFKAQRPCPYYKKQPQVISFNGICKLA
jgi:Caspase domain